MTPADATEVAAALPVRAARVTDDRPTTLARRAGRRRRHARGHRHGVVHRRQSAADRPPSSAAGASGSATRPRAPGLAGRSSRATLHTVDGLRPRTRSQRRRARGLRQPVRPRHRRAGLCAPRLRRLRRPRGRGGGQRRRPSPSTLMREGAGWVLRSAAHSAGTRGEPLCLTGGLGPHYPASLTPTSWRPGPTRSTGRWRWPPTSPPTFPRGKSHDRRRLPPPRALAAQLRRSALRPAAQAASKRRSRPASSRPTPPSRPSARSRR